MIASMTVTELTQRIHRLSNTLSNQIAAGEVIERPASVVKELLENSLDAGASDIKLDIRKGGRLLIAIQDNGRGIHPDDLPLALAQHATSKLITQTDLERISTLGFRGEALSSIASVSRLKLSSRIANQAHGWMIEVTPGRSEGESGSQQATPTGITEGTHVEVRDLFFNIPARRKFLRTDNTEIYHTREIVRRVALSRYDVSFHLKHNNKTILQCSGNHNNFTERAQTIFGKTFLANSFGLDYERDGLRLWGWFGYPEIARSQVDQQYFYLNGRVIRDKQVNHAIRMATQDHLYSGKHAVYVLFLEMDVSLVDVNVHPAKYEIRFRQARDVHDFIYSALMQACGSINVQGHDDQELEVQGQVAQHPFTKDDKGHSAMQPFSAFPAFPVSKIQSRNSSKYGDNSFRENSFPVSNDFLMIDDRHLITRVEDECLLFDVFLCQEMIALSKLKNDFIAESIRRRPLLVPLTMVVSIDVADFIESKVSVFESFAVKIERLTPDSLLIREIPQLLEYADITDLINEMIPLIKSGIANEEIIVMMSKHVNDAGRVKIDNRTVSQLVTEVRSVDLPANVGEKTAWRLLDSETLSELLKRKH